MFKTMGTTAGNTMMVQMGDTPIKNWSGTPKEDYPTESQNKISGMELNKYKQRGYGCFSCPVQCGAIMKVPEVGLEETHRPEYETCAVFGPMLLNDNLMSIFTVNDLCNRAVSCGYSWVYFNPMLLFAQRPLVLFVSLHDEFG